MQVQVFGVFGIFLLLPRCEAFSPTVNIDCLSTPAVEVQLTDASVTGKVSLYNGVHVLCDEIDTLTATITVTFTTCLNPADFPAAETEFIIYVSEGGFIQAGDKIFRVTCHLDFTETVNEVSITTSGTVTDYVSPIVDLTITDMSDNPVTWLTIGTQYKMKLECQTPFVAEYDNIARTVTANDIVILIEEGCSNYESFFSTFTKPGQCLLENTFEGFTLTAITQPIAFVFHTQVFMCAGPCPTPPNCGEVAWGRRRRDISKALENATIGIQDIYKEITVFPEHYFEHGTGSTVTSFPNVMSSPTSNYVTFPVTKDSTCMPGTAVYITLAVLCVGFVLGTVIDGLFLLAVVRLSKHRLKLGRNSVFKPTQN